MGHLGSNGHPRSVLTRRNPMLSDREQPQLGEVIPPETGELDAIKTRNTRTILGR